MIPHWPKTAALSCGCRVGLMRQGEETAVMYFPCNPQCLLMELVKQESIKAGKKWEKRNVSNN